MEDLIEELVGEIYDETDRDVIAVRHDADGSMVLSGQFPVHDLSDIGIDTAANGHYSTVAGLVLDRLGRLPTGPATGSTWTAGCWRSWP
ncbi:MAG: transporter associated domain-containing protein [Acidimicrobiales bacterium]